MAIVTGLDHVIILAEDLERSGETIRRLGFRTTPLGLHSPHKGTANVTTVLPDRRTYFELLGIVTPTETNAPVQAGLAAGRHLHGIALKTGDAPAAAEAFRAAGIGTGVVNAFSRPVALPGGTREAAFRTTYVTTEGAAGLFVFVCEHLTPDVVWREDYLEQPNGALALVEVAGVSTDLPAMEAAWRRIAPEAAVTRGDDRLVVSLPNGRIVLASPDAYARAYGAPPAGDPALGALVLSVADLSATRAALSARNVPFEAADGAIRVPAEAAEGVTFVFRQR